MPAFDIPERTFNDKCRLSSDLSSAVNTAKSSVTSKKNPLQQLKTSPPSDVECVSVTPEKMSDSHSDDYTSDTDSSSQDSAEFDKVMVASKDKQAELAGMHDPDPLLIENPKRFVLFPLKHNDVSV